MSVNRSTALNASFDAQQFADRVKDFCVMDFQDERFSKMRQGALRKLRKPVQLQFRDMTPSYLELPELAEEQ